MTQRIPAFFVNSDNMQNDHNLLKPIIFFDGVCNLCSHSVLFVLRNDSKQQFQFASLQSNFGKNILLKYNLPLEHFGSFILLQNNKIYTQSTATLKVAAELKFPMNWLAIGWVIPKFIRDKVYNYIAANRYRWFGKKNICFIPDEKWGSRFIE